MNENSQLFSYEEQAIGNFLMICVNGGGKGIIRLQLCTLVNKNVCVVYIKCVLVNNDVHKLLHQCVYVNINMCTSLYTCLQYCNKRKERLTFRSLLDTLKIEN